MRRLGRGPVIPWVVVAGTASSLLLLLLTWLEVPGPWLPVAAGCAAASVAAAILAATHVRWLAIRHEAMEARAAVAESERDSLHQELQRHDQLEQQLLQAKQAAESAVLAKGEFLATVSHEIRTPLNGILPMLDLLARGSLSADQRDLLGTARESSQHLLRIVDDILDYSKLEANRLELETTTFNLRELLDGVLQLMQRPADAKGLRIKLQLDPTVRLPVRGDPVRLRQVLSNLISNAVKFTERGAITVNVQRLGENPTQHHLRFEVRDTGIGIDPQAQAHLFHSFSQADASTTRLYGGTGLGLAICKRIVELMGGRIGLQSQPGQGSVFWFDIPLLKVVGDLRRDESELEQERVLLVSPDPRLRRRLALLLPNWGMGMTTVETTQEALERLRNTTPVGDTATFTALIADLDGLRHSARALHRGLTRTPAYAGVRLIWLYGQDSIPEELRTHSTLLPRQAPDNTLRNALIQVAPPEPPIYALSEPTIALPPERQLPEIAAPYRSASASPSALPGTAPRMLLVEDNPVNLLVAQKMLSVLGYQADTATDGGAALAHMHEHPYALVLMDCQMPVLDGYTATRRWREHEAEQGEGKHLPIIAMTANAMASDRQRCLDAGMDDYLSKPVSREQLEACLQRWLPGGAKAGTRRPAVSRLPTVAADATTDTPKLTSPEDAHETHPAVEAPPGVATDNAAVPPPVRQAAPSFPVLDNTVLEELQEIAGDETSRIIILFLEDAPKLIARLEEASAVPDIDGMREAAHTLKSSSANVGALALSTAAKRIELGARAQKLDRPAVAVALVIAEYARVRIALQGYLAKAEQAATASASSSATAAAAAATPPAARDTGQSSILVNR